jgi:hypothetical protein
MHFRQGLQNWADGFATIAARTRGIERVFDLVLYALSLFAPTQWLHIGFGKEKPSSANKWTEAYVVLALALSILCFLFPSRNIGWVSTYFSAVTLIAILNIVFLQRLFGPAVSAERSLLLFMCNVAQIVLMFATWYSVFEVENPLLISVLTFATINHSVKTPNIAMTQIAIDFVLLAVYLSHLVGRVGGRSG